MAAATSSPLYGSNTAAMEAIGRQHSSEVPLQHGKAAKLPVRQSRASAPGKKSSKKSSDAKSSPFRFVVVDHPDQLRDRQEMRENRMHVMHDYLNKERSKPGSHDARVNSTSQRGQKRKSLNTRTMSPGDENSAIYEDSWSPATMQSSDSQTHANSKEEIGDSSSGIRDIVISQHKLPRRTGDIHPFQDVNDEHLVNGIGGRFENAAYLRAMPNDIFAGPGAIFEPFGAWASFNDPSLNVNELKFSCCQRFGSENLASQWIPALLRARHSFLSTLCISSSHDAIMTRALIPAHAQSTYKNIQRWKVKREVIAMVADCMNDPKKQAADETILAVLHLLNSDIMGCDDRDMRIHQDGLIKMVMQRGGLDQLGLGGQLSAVLTITNYLIAALREIQPHRQYIDFASHQVTQIQYDDQPLPESPIYCRHSGYHTITSQVRPSSDTYALLDLLRLLTDSFFIENARRSSNDGKSFQNENSTEKSYDTVADLYAKIIKFAPGQDKEFNDMNERYTYESLRITSLIYAHALHHKIPFSKAAEEIHIQNVASASSKVRKNQAVVEEKPLPLPQQLKHALMRTDISMCWDHLGGVLFYITLIGGAAANPGPLADTERAGDAEDARKLLAALAVRTCIVLGFQYGPAVMDTLKKIVMIEAALALTTTWNDTEKSGSMVDPDESKAFNVGVAWDGDEAMNEILNSENWADYGVGVSPLSSEESHFRPVEPVEIQKGFADFADDFWNDGILAEGS